MRLSKTSVALVMVTAVLDRLELLPRDAMEEAARRGGGKHVEENLQAVAAGRELG